MNDKDKLESLWLIREEAMKDMYASECRFSWDEATRDRFSAALQAFMEADFAYIAEFNKQTEDTSDAVDSAYEAWLEAFNQEGEY